MAKYSEAFVGFDTAKKKHALAVAEGGRNGEIRWLGEINSSPATVEKVIGKLAARYAKLHVCYEAGPTGYGAVSPGQGARARLRRGCPIAHSEEARRPG
jgi:transposase